MKKAFLILAVVVVVFASAIAFASCIEKNPASQPPKVPTMEKSSFYIWYEVNDNGETDYELKWTAYYSTSYKVQCDATEITVTEPKFSLNGYSADTVHTVTVTANGANGTKSAPVEIKFKGEKLPSPINVRLYGDTKSFGYKGCEDTSYYVLSCEELTLDPQTSKPIGTGKIKTTPIFSDRLYIDDLRNIYSKLNLYALEKLRVQAIPYNGNAMWFEYGDDTDVITFFLPSDFSEQSVNLYEGVMSNPSNLRWELDDLAEHPSYAKIKWDGAVGNYTYKITQIDPNGNSVTIAPQEKGISQWTIGFESDDSGEHTVKVEPSYYDFNFIGEDQEEKSVTYMFYAPQPVTETLKYKVNQTVLEAPKNVRIDGNNVVWDEVENARSYNIRLTRGNEVTNIWAENAQKSLQSIVESISLGAAYGYAGDYGISVSANANDPELVKFENNVPEVNAYRDSDYSEVAGNKVRIKSIPTVQNVQINYQAQTITWDGVPQAVSYYIGFYKNGGGTTYFTDTETEFTWDCDISQYSTIHIKAVGDYAVTYEGGICTITAPSVYVFDMKTDAE